MSSVEELCTKNTCISLLLAWVKVRVSMCCDTSPLLRVMSHLHSGSRDVM